MYRNILAAIDREDEAGTDLIARRCASLSRLCDARIDMIHVRMRVPDAYSRHLPWHWEADQAQEIRGWLEDVARQHGFADRLSGVLAPSGSIAREVVRAATEKHVDVIVVAAHEMTLGRIILGSNAHAIMRDAACDVLVARAQSED